jgi:hypothetical protein
MKKLTLSLSIALLFLYSCKKSNSGSAPSSNYYLSSVVAIGTATTSNPQSGQIVDSFNYDTLHRINTYIESDYDSSQFGPELSTWNIQFIYQGSNSWPSSYNYSDGGSIGGPYGSHLLSYDAEHRIMRDSCLNGSGDYTDFSYTNNSIVITFFDGGTILPASVNTYFISNGNVSKETLASPQVSSSLGVVNYTYSSIANPAYHPLIFNSIGPLLTALNLSAGTVDFISQNAWQGTSQAVSVSLPDFLTNYTLDTDNKGRLSKMTLNSDSSGGWNTILFNYY